MNVYIYIWFQKTQHDIGTIIQISKYFDHKTTFPDTPRHFRLAIEISRKIPSLCGSLEFKKNNIRTNMLGFAAYAIYFFRNQRFEASLQSFRFPKISQPMFKYAHIHNFRMNLIETLEINHLSLKRTHKTKLYFDLSHFSQTIYFSKSWTFRKFMILCLFLWY